MKVKFLIVLFCLPILFSCKYGLHEVFWRNNDVNDRSPSIEKLAPSVTPFLQSLPESYACIILTDIHFGYKKRTIPTKAFFRWLDNLSEKPSFCLVLGDIADHGANNEFDEFKNFQNEINNYKIPVYGIPGNHDLYNSGWKYWIKVSFPHSSAYYFETKYFQWFFLDTANGTLGSPQFYFLQENLESSSKPKLIFSHYPLYAGGLFYFALSNTHERATLISLFANNNVKLYCAGHYHKGAFYDFGVFQEQTLKSFTRQSCYILHIDESTEKPSFKLEEINLSKF